MPPLDAKFRKPEKSEPVIDGRLPDRKGLDRGRRLAG